MELNELFKTLRENKINISLHGENLKVGSDAPDIDVLLLEKIRENKSQIIDYLKTNISHKYEQIPLAPAADAYPLSSAQMRLWILSQFEGGNTAYIIPTTYTLKGILNIEHFKRSLLSIVSRHEILRTVFREDQNQDIKQYILSLESMDIEINYKDLRDDESRDEKVKKYIHEESVIPFNLHAGPLFRLGLFHLRDDYYVFSCVMHHIISDAWSIQVMIQELFLTYNALTKNEIIPLTPLKIQYKDYSIWQHSYKLSENMAASKAYWLSQFSGDLPILDAFADNARPKEKTYNGALYHKIFDQKLSKGLKEIIRSEGGTLFMGLTGLLKVLLFRYTNQSDITLGTPIARRNHPDLKDQIGFYINTLALRTKFDGEDSFKVLLNKVKTVTIASYEHQDYPFDELVEELNLFRDTSRNPLFDIMISLQNVDIGSHNTRAKEIEGLKIESYESAFLGSMFDLTFDFGEVSGELYLSVNYNTDIYNSSTIECMCRHLDTLLRSAIEHPDMSIKELEILSAADRIELLESFNDTTVSYPQGDNIVSLFEKQAISTPDHVAIVFEEEELTYKELDEKSNQLARYLLSRHSLGRGVLCGIMMDRSLDMIVSILAILKTGSGYVPIDVDYPQDRIDYMVEDSGCILVIDSALYADFANTCESYDSNSLEISISGNDLAYVIYTSGTTGHPKGVMVEHKGVVNLCFWHIETFDVGPHTKSTLYSNYSFDASVWELFPYLLKGASLYIVPSAVRLDLIALNNFYEDSGITHSFLPTALCESFIQIENHSLSYLFTGGDRLLTSNTSNHYKLVNNYGPTENSVVSTSFTLCQRLSQDMIPIGSPISNTQLYILDGDLRLVPKGAVGEICVSGSGLARGYLNRPELTAEKFISHPFKEGERLYRTGDLGRWNYGGYVEFMGRNDDQVKIRGYRIELGEIAQVMNQHPLITNCLVHASEGSSENKELILYYVSESSLSIRDLRSYLSERLPSYMIPGYYMQLGELPLTSNGKVDRKALPMPEDMGIDTGVEYVSPQTSTEKILVEIWQELLGIEPIGIHDNFFDLGGHSLKATRLSSQISKHLGVQLALTDLFRYSVLQDQALLIDNSQKTIFASIPQSPVQTDYPLSSSQKRMWILSQFEAGNLAYSIPSSHHIHGSLDLVSLEESFRRIVSRHEILRTVFRLDEHLEARQYILSAEAFEFNIDYRDLRGIDLQEDQVRDYIYRESVVAFDLSHGPLLRLGLFRLGDEDYVLNSVMHHIISDAWSMEVMVRELMLLYNGLSQGRDVVLPGLNLQYRDYSVWQQDNLQNGSSEKHARYWQEQFTSVPGVLDLPTDYLRPVVKTYNGAVYNKLFSSTLTQGLKDLVHESGSTLFMGLLGMLNVLFYRYTGQKDIVLGTSVAGRNHPDLEDQIGFYINTLALRTRFEGGDSFRMLLDKVKATVFAGLEHQDYPFDELVESLSLATDLSRNPLFDVIVTLQNADIGNNQSVEGMQGLNFSSSDAAFLGSIFDMTFNFEERGDVLSLSLMYNTDLFSSERISHLGDHLEHLLGSILGDADLQLNSLDYIPANEVALLEQYNTSQIREVSPMSIVSLFRRQCGHTPDRIALSFNGHDMSYAELDSKSDQLAHYLLSSYELDGPCIGLLLDKSPLLLIGILGILKSGRGYLPIDINTPDIRRSEILSDSGCSVLLSHTDYLMELSSVDVSVMYLDIELDNAPAGSIASLADPSWDDLAYVMYTSGTTGRSKGVMVSHGSVVSLVRDVDYVSFTSDQVILSTGSVSFDATTFEYWGALLNGGRLVLCSREVLLDPVELESLILSQDVTMMWFTSGWFNELVEHSLGIFSGLQIVLVGGDRLSPIHIARVGSAYPDLTLINGYGPTENTTFSLTHKISSCDPSDTVPIGLPFTNRGVYILDANMNLVGHGVMGELYLFGAGLSQGYLGDSVLTAEKFIPHPFKEGERLYRTGDLGRWNYGGYVEFMGRNDDQVKIRGYRIELGEIAQVMNQHPLITNCLVHATEGSSENKDLILYYVSESSLSIRDLRSYLSERLPSYMIPGYYLPLDELPLTSNGKVDRKALPMPEDMGIDTGMEYVSPQTSTEKILVKIWSDVLSLDADNIGLYDDFFDLGGHSLKATRLSSQISSRFEVQLGLKELFRYTKLEDQALLIDNSQKTVLASIPQASVQADYPLSSSQKRMWILSQFEDANLAYNVNGVYEFDSGFDQSAFELAYLDLIVRHESLRTVFRANDQGDIRQLILDPDPDKFQVSYFDFQDRNEADESSQKISDYITEAFDLYNGPLFKLGLFRLSPERLVLAYSMHHIISDGWSLQVMIRELLSLYHAHATGTSSGLLPLRIQYKDYVMWQIMENSTAHYDEMKAYWLGEFSGDLPVLNLAGDYPRPVVKSYKGSTYHTILDKTLTAGLHRVSKNSGATLYMSLLSSINVLLYRYSGDTDIILGCPITGRDHIDLDNQIGFYLNTLAIRSRFSSEDSFTKLLSDVRDTTMNGYKYKGYGFDELVEDLDLVRDISRNPLFDVLVVLQNNDIGGDQAIESESSTTVTIQDYERSDDGISKFDLSFDFSEVSGELYLFVNYNTDIYNSSTIERMCRHLDTLLRSAIEHPDAAIKELKILSDPEEYELLEVFSGTSEAYPQGETVISLFEKQAISTPDHVAIVFEEEELTYKELDEKSNQLAHYLTSQGIGKEVLVPVCFERSLEMIIGILGIMKAGGAYVPIDPKHPKSRIETILEDCNAEILLTQEKLKSDLFAGQDIRCIALNAEQALWENLSTDGLAHEITPNQLVYIIYTSGTTGKPKGVMIEHHNLYNFLKSFSSRVFEEGFVRLLSIASSTFDPSLLEYFIPLTQGGELILIHDEDLDDANKLASKINYYKPNVIECTPSRWQTLKEINWSCDFDLKILCGAEHLSNDLKSYLLSNSTSCWNLYGPTETTIWSTVIELNDAVNNVGKPIPNTEIYILDADLKLVPKGISGEIYIGGGGLSRGYLNRPELTEEKFISHVFKSGKQLYKTGDLGRWLEDGNIEFIGRSDNQVKIRGYRIELGEIESQLDHINDVQQSAVIVVGENISDKQLVAYYTSDEEIDSESLKSGLKSVLPEYMVPKVYLYLDKFPLTVSGKINRKALPIPDIIAYQKKEYVSPQTSTEKILVEIWSDVLSLDADNIGLYDDFFDLGGHSLKATRLSSQISSRFEVQLGLKELFRHTKLEDQALLIDNSQKTVLASIPQASVQADYPLSSSQKRMWILSQFEDANLAYNVNGVYEFDSGFDQSAFELAYLDLIVRHESLRTVFRANDQGDIRQLILDPDSAKFHVSYFDFQDRNEADESSQKISDYITEAFDLYNGPLFKAGLFRLSPERLVLAYSMHHIISDGWSLQVMIRELLSLYHAHATGTSSGLLPLRIQYKDYVMWQIMENSTAHYDEMKAYWLGEFSGDLPVLNLAGDYPRPVVKSYKGSTYHTILDKTLTAGLHRVSKNSGATLYMSLLSSINVLLYRYSGDTDIILGCPITGRDHIDLDNQIGFYLNTLAIRSRFSSEDSFTKLLSDVRDTTMNGYKYKGYGFDELVEDLDLVRDISRNPLFDVAVVLQNNDIGGSRSQTEVASSESDPMIVQGYEKPDDGISKFDLTFDFSEVSGELYLFVNYNTDIYNSSTIERMCRHLDTLLRSAIEHPDMSIKELEILSAADRIELLESFNDTTVSYPQGDNIVSLFEKQAISTPDHVAIVFEEEELTYKELDEKSNQLAHYLTSLGVTKETLVPICVVRSLEMIISILAILKSGGAYIPIDPDYPESRIGFILEDCAARFVLTQKSLLKDRSKLSQGVLAISLDTDASLWENLPKTSLGVEITPDQLIYVIYTSGTTGNPKGVMNIHGGVLNRLLWMQEEIQITSQSVLLQKTPYVFDVSVWEILMPFITGCKLVLATPDGHKKPDYLVDVINTHGIDLVHFVPSMLSVFLEFAKAYELKSLKNVICSGEALPLGLKREFTKHFESINLYNYYGPTEAAVDVTRINLNVYQGEDVVPIGKPVANTEAYIFDSDLKLVPLGVAGELFLGGVQLSRGYLNRPELTAEKFISHPFKEGERLYRTGDLARWLADGNIEFIGRNDDQVKIRGYRIELGEIESELDRMEGIQQSVVLAIGDGASEKQLVAYYVSAAALGIDDLKNHLKAVLPEYMVPKVYMHLDSLPLTVNGKIDRKALPMPDARAYEKKEYVSPQTSTEKILVEIWQELLGIEPIGIHDNFFDLGGNSLSVIKFKAIIVKRFNLDLNVSVTFKLNNVKNIAEYLDLIASKQEVTNEKDDDDEKDVLFF